MSTMQTRLDRAYPLVHPDWVEATIVPCEPDSRAACQAELREMSATSAKLLVAGPPELPGRCKLRLASSKLARAWEIPAEIGWARPNLAGDWQVECEFHPALSERQFDEILDSGLFERRTAVRHQTRIRVAVEWLLGQQRLPGMVRDLSEGGLCLMTAQPPQHSRDVYVVVGTGENEKTMQLKVRWTLAVGTNHLIGCQFVQGSDFNILRKLHSTSQSLNEYSRAGKPVDWSERPRM